MKRKTLIVVVAVSIIAVIFIGCKKDSSESQQDVVKTAAEYKAQAEKEINADNMNAELEKVEKAIESETEQP